MITAFLPCRAGSERVPKKNTKDFAGVTGGLLYLKLDKLLKVKNIDAIVLSSNDKEVFKIASIFNSKKIIFDKRPEYLATSSTSTDDLIAYVPKIIRSKHILWTHVTSPFIDQSTYDCAIDKYLKLDEDSNFDSLMSVNKIQTFIWNKKGPINYDRNKEKWPRTQTLPELYEINSGFFISSRENYIRLNDRIGNRPYLFSTNNIASFDIDWPEDFDLAEIIYKKRAL